MATAKKLRGSRLAVAETLLDGSKSASEIGRSLERPTGSIFGVLRRMVTEGLVAADTGKPERGTLYALSPEARKQLEEIRRGAPHPGKIVQGQRLIVVETPDAPTAVQQIFAGPDAEFIEWAIETGAGGWLLALTGEESYPAQRLRMALEAAGAKSREMLAGTVIAGDELFARAQWLLDDVERRQ